MEYTFRRHVVSESGKFPTDVLLEECKDFK